MNGEYFCLYGLTKLSTCSVNNNGANIEHVDYPGLEGTKTSEQRPAPEHERFRICTCTEFSVRFDWGQNETAIILQQYKKLMNSFKDTKLKVNIYC